MHLNTTDNDDAKDDEVAWGEGKGGTPCPPFSPFLIILVVFVDVKAPCLLGGEEKEGSRCGGGVRALGGGGRWVHVCV